MIFPIHPLSILVHSRSSVLSRQGRGLGFKQSARCKTKFIALIVNVCLFYAKFLVDSFDVSSDFYALDFLRFA